MHLLLLLSTFAAAQGAKPWKVSAELGFVKTGGNTDTSSLSNKERFELKHGRIQLELDAAALHAKTKGATTAENYAAGQKLSWRFSGRDYAFQRLTWDRDRFSRIDDRVVASLGVGRQLLGGDDDWVVEAGAGRLWEERVAPASDRALTVGRLYTRYAHKFSETTSFSQDAKYVPNLGDFHDYLLSTETAVTAGLSKNLSFKTSYTFKRKNTPPAGVKKDDTQLGVTLIAAY